MNSEDKIYTRSAVISNYKGYDVLVGVDNKVYLGLTKNYNHLGLEQAFYDNSDKSLIHISDNEKMYAFLYGSGWVKSQQEMIDEGVFTEKDYAEFAELSKGVLSGLEKTQDITFKDEPFRYPLTMTVLVVPPLKEPYIKEINTGLESLQKEVGGLIEVVYPFEDKVGVICNEDGKFNGMELNRALYTDKGKMYDIIAGTFLVAGLGDEDFTSLTKEQTDKFSKRFQTPETFVRLNGEIVVVPIKPSIKDKLKQTTSKGQDQAKPPRKPPDIEL